MINKSIFSSKNDVWETPQKLFDQLNQEFNFTIDVCANDQNAKCKKYFTEKENGLKQDWKGNIWCNPPYGRSINKWIKKAYYSKAIIVLLLPARTDTKWFHDYIYNKHEIRFIKGRLKFGESTNYAPFPSMIVIMRNEEKTNDQ